MKQQLIFALIVFILLLLMPITGRFSAQGTEHTRPAPQTSAQSTTAPEPRRTQSPASSAAASGEGGSVENESIAVVRTETGKTETLDMKEYLMGCVAAEIPLSYNEEALKAQAVASYTYARYQREIAKKETLSDSGTSDQGYLSRSQRAQRWGDKAALYEDKLKTAVEAALGQSITYEGQPIFAAFHSVSPGKTESAENYWGGTDYPYLQPVDSPGDRLAPDYTQTATLELKEMKSALKKADDVELGKDPAKWFGKPKRSDSGTILEIEIGGQRMSGREARELLGLRSADFDAAYNSKTETFQIVTRGYGHGVGMSQYGADFMARQGSDYIEILEHYYPGAKVE